jgi:hypothetical protein
MTKLYVLAGYDETGSFDERISYWKKRAHDKGDVEIIYPSGPNESMAHLASRIKPPANILLECHGGGDGNFTWGDNQFPFYYELFNELPRQGIISVTVEGCCGESAISMMQGLPDGTLLQARVSSKISGAGGSVGGEIAKEITSYEEITPLSIILEELDGTVPSHYIDWGYTANPNNVLPHTIGIGGHPPITLDLNQKMAELSTQAKMGRLDISKFQQAMMQVKQHFDPLDDSSHASPSQSERIAVDHSINSVAHKLAAGEDTNLFTIEEKRIAYALTITNLYNSGEMKQLVKQQSQIINAEPAPSTGVSWGGLGNEHTAELQAIAELVFHKATDRWGAYDHHVDGIEGHRTVRAVKQLETHYGVQSEAALFDRLIHDPQVIQVFGEKVLNGEKVADIHLIKATGSNHTHNI